MKIAELRKQSEDKLKENLLAHKKELFNLRFQVANSVSIKTNRISVVRKTVARIKTLLNEFKLKKIEKKDA